MRPIVITRYNVPGLRPGDPLPPNFPRNVEPGVVYAAPRGSAFVGFAYDLSGRRHMWERHTGRSGDGIWVDPETGRTTSRYPYGSSGQASRSGRSGGHRGPHDPSRDPRYSGPSGGGRRSGPQGGGYGGRRSPPGGISGGPSRSWDSPPDRYGGGMRHGPMFDDDESPYGGMGGRFGGRSGLGGFGGPRGPMPPRPGRGHPDYDDDFSRGGFGGGFGGHRPGMSGGYGGPSGRSTPTNASQEDRPAPPPPAMTREDVVEETDWYEFMELEPDCTEEEYVASCCSILLYARESRLILDHRIEAKYKNLRKTWHPDRKLNSPEGKDFWTNKFQDLAKAYEILKDPMQRQQFDHRRQIKERLKNGGGRGGGRGARGGRRGPGGYRPPGW
ncbi:MAG: hypothetical protein M1814_002909 [Vezdaea aestivalis]|nr:MAG: hypothetical protein M1814_002909 [Vezdaea aestivalis]